MTTRLKVGDKEAFTEIYRLYHQEIYKYLYKLSSANETLVEDILQQVFLKLWRVKETLHPERGIKPLLFIMARNSWIDVSKKEVRRRAATLVESDQESELSAKSNPPDQNFHYQELKICIDESISGLDEPFREVLILSRHHGLTYGEISQILGISIKTVEARMSRALEVLRLRLQPFMEG